MKISNLTHNGSDLWHVKDSSPKSQPQLRERKKTNKVIKALKEDKERYLGMKQKDAAKELGVSLSTLKRVYYKLYKCERWPLNRKNKGIEKISKISFILNPKDVPEKRIAFDTQNFLYWVAQKRS